VYGGFGLVMLLFVRGDRLLVWSTNIYNYALGVSCWHALAINVTLLPAPLRPGWPRRVGLALAGAFFVGMALLTTVHSLGGFGR
jgi:hypothetical protein